MSETTRLILIRHGESQVTVDRVIGGDKTCSGLSDLGRRQAGALRDRLVANGGRFGEHEVDALWSSTMPRAKETAAIVAAAFGDLECQIDHDLSEHRPGDADGLPFAEFENHFEVFDFDAEPFRPMAPNAESLADFHYRTGAALHRVIAAGRGATSVVACHAGVIDVALRSLLGLGLRPTFDLHTLNTSVTEFARDEGRKPWKLVRYNDTAHLVGLPRATTP